MKIVFVLSLFWLFAFRTSAQIGTSGSLQSTDSLIVWSYSASEQLSYNLITLTNLTGANLDVDYRVHLPASLPNAWQIEVEYPHSGGYVSDMQGYFRLAGDNSTARLFFLAVLPNGQTGTDTIRVVFAPSNNAADSIEVIFVPNIIADPVAVQEQASQQQKALYPNPVREGKIYWQRAHFSASVAYIYSAQGQLLGTAPMQGQAIELPSDLPPAQYWMQVRDAATLQIIDTQPFIRL